LAIEVARKNRIDLMLGGAFGLAGYTGHWRNTKDVDFFVLPETKDALIDGLLKAGFEDYYDTLAYDRGWIYRAVLNEVIVDLIWATPNRRTFVDEQWFPNATPIELRGQALHLVPLEELFWIKMYILQKDRCDWPDLINLLSAQGEVMDWDHLFFRLEEDLPLLAGLLQIFTWLCPNRAHVIPEKIRKRLGIRETSARDAIYRQDRINLLDSRHWFAGAEPKDRPLEL